MARGTVSNEVPHPSTIRYTVGMSDLKLIDLNKYKRNPSHIEGKNAWTRCLKTLYAEVLTQKWLLK